MPTITSNGTGGGNWGTGSTWVGGVVPANNDTVVIASGDTVIFNVDQSGFADGMDGMTITGTLKVSTSTSSYMKMKAATYIGGAGTFNIGEAGAGNNIPFAVKFTLTGGAGWYITGAAGLTMTVYGTEPDIPYVKLSGAEALGQTELGVDTDVTGDIWAVGDTVSINNVNKAVNVEYRVIDAGGISADHIDVTVGLTGEKVINSLVILITRNVQIISDATVIRSITPSKLTIGSGLIRNTGATNNVIDKCVGLVMTGGLLCGGMYQLYQCHLSSISNAMIVNANWGSRDNTGMSFNNCMFVSNQYDNYLISKSIYKNCKFHGERYSTRAVSNTTFNNCLFSGNSSGIFATGMAIYLTNCVFENNTIDVEDVGFFEAHNTVFNSATEVSGYASLYNYNVTSNNHNNDAGALKVWGGGGIVTSQITVMPVGYTLAYLHAVASAIYPCYWRQKFTVAAGESVDVEVQLRKDASMTYLPRVYLMASIGNPLAGATAVDSFTMTDSTDTWESDTFSITNSTDYDQEYTLWFVAKNATGNAYSAYDITTQGGGTSSVKIMPLGRVGL